MKIRKISLENLNSLVGEHELDLTAEPIASAGIFAITGQTGAGKSTLLDAITLALYGRAARYGGGVPADMMSRHQGRCRAEVEFEVKGEVFRAEWILRKARDKADGKLQPVKAFVYDQAGTALNQRAVDAKDKVEELCGLNYERFLRSVLLAQGEFAKFLKSDENERAGLLESLTGTAVYSQISVRVFEEAKRREQVVADEQTLLGALVPLEKEVRAEKEAKFKEGAKAQKESTALLEKLSGGLVKGEQLAERAGELASIGGKIQALTDERKAKAAGLVALKNHQAAEVYFPFLSRADDGRAEVERVEKQCNLALGERATAEKNRDAGRAAAAQHLQRWSEAKQKAIGLAEAEKKKLLTVQEKTVEWLAVNDADAGLKDLLPDLSAQISALAGERSHWKQAKKKIEDLKGEALEKQKTADSEKKELEVKQVRWQKADKSLATTKKGLDELLNSGDEAQRRVELERLEQVIAAQGKLAKTSEKLKEITSRLAPERERSGGLKAAQESATELLAAHEAHMRTEMLRAGMEEHRANLEEGSECPLCGSLEHPFAEGGLESGALMVALKKKIVTAKEAMDLAAKSATESAQVLAKLEMQVAADNKSLAEQRAEIDQVLSTLNVSEPLADELRRRRTALAEVEKARKQFEGASEEAVKSSRGLELAKQEQKSRAEALEKIGTQLKQEESALTKAKQTGKLVTERLAEALSSFGAEVPGAGHEDDARGALQKREKLFTENERARIAGLEALKQKESELTTLAKELDDLLKRQAALQVVEGVTAAEWEVDSVADLEQRLGELEKALAAADVAAKERKKQLAEAQTSLVERQEALDGALNESDFEGADAVRAVRLESEQLVRLMALEKRLAESELALKAQKETCDQSLVKLRAKKVPEGEQLLAMRTQKEALEAKAEVERDAIAMLKAELAADDQCLHQLEQKGAALAEAKESVRVWQQLNGMIGSADGKRFRRFAQGLSLDVLLRNANQHLRRLSDRYQLGRVTGEELGLEIIDRYQASVTRPMASLSGGESFLTSLALALGLSDLAGRNVQIDSLFIDEGFGSLDGDTLDEAISALEGLRLRDKTVGVISHVELLKERISTQVVVGRNAAGQGKIDVVG